MIEIFGDFQEDIPTNYEFLMMTITMNRQELKFLNSSGMSVLSRFVIGVRKKKTTQLVVKDSQSISWQEKSLNNWQRLMPTLALEWQ